MTEAITDDSPDGFAKQAKMVINVAVLSLLGWVAMTVQESTKEIAVLQVMVANLQSQMSEAKGSTANRYTSYDAEKDFRSRDTQINHNTNEIEMIEKHLEAIELNLAQRRK